MATRPSKRQEAKERTKQLKALYFVVRWLDDATKYDIVQSKDIVPPEDSDVLSLPPGTQCSAVFQGKEFKVEIIASGTYSEMKTVQSRKEQEVPSSTDDDQEKSSVSSSVKAHSPKKKAKQSSKKPTKDDQEKLSVPSSVKAKEKAKQSPNNPTKGKCPNRQGDSYGARPPPDTVVGTKASKKVKSPCKQSGNSLAKGNHGGGSFTSAPVKFAKLECEQSTLSARHNRNQMKTQRALVEFSGPYGTATKVSTFKMPKTPTRSKRRFPEKLHDDDMQDSETETEPLKKKEKLIESSSSSDSEDDLTDHVSAYEAKRAVNIAQNSMFKQLIGLSNSTRFSEASVTADLAILKGKVRNLETTQSKLRRKLQDQDKELQRLRRSSSFDMSSASESVVIDSESPRIMKSRFSPQIEKNVPTKLKEEESHALPFGNHKIDNLRLANAKLQSDAGSAALKLLDCLFTTEELVNCNPSGNSKSADPVRKQTIAPLDPSRMKYIYDFLESKWPGSSDDKKLRRKLTQKCTDYYTDSRFKHLRWQPHDSQ